MKLVAVALHTIKPTEASKPESSFRGSAQRDCVVVQYQAFGRMDHSVATLRGFVAAPTFVDFPFAMHDTHLLLLQERIRERLLTNSIHLTTPMYGVNYSGWSSGFSKARLAYWAIDTVPAVSIVANAA